VTNCPRYNPRYNHAGVGFFAAAVSLLLATLGVALPTRAADKVSLREQNESGRLDRVTATIDVSGELRLPTDGKTQKIPLAVQGRFEFDQRLMAATAKSRKAVRVYRTAQAEVNVAGQKSTTLLPKDRRAIVALTTASRGILFSASGRLSRDHLELIDIPASPTDLGLLLPPQKVSVEESWTHSGHAMARLFNLTAIEKCEAASTLKSVEGSLARVELNAALAGQAHAAATKLRIAAKYTFDTRSGRITWFTAAIEEERERGPAQPAFKVVAKVNVKVEPLAESAVLARFEADDPSLQLTAASAALELQSRAAGYRLAHSRSWWAVQNERDLTILRMIDSQGLVAQCNIRPARPLADGKVKSLEAFKYDVQQALGDRFKKVSSASQHRTADGREILRVEADGTVQGVAVHWIYYHILGADRRRATAVFSVDPARAKRLGAADRKLIAGLEFLPKETAEPTPASGE